MNQCGYFMPVKIRNCYTNPVKIQVKGKTKQMNTPYFSLSDEDNTVQMFVDALSKSQQDDAIVYISKNYAKDFDLDELAQFFNHVHHYKNLVKVEFSQTPKNCKTNSILVLNSDSQNSIVHLHLVKEPDHFSNWKIYGIEKE